MISALRERTLNRIVQILIDLYRMRLMSLNVDRAIQQLRGQIPELFLDPWPGRKPMSTPADEIAAAMLDA